MSRIEPVVDSLHSKPWLEPLGKLVLNFGAIELQTYLWLGDLSSDGNLPYQAIEWSFKHRVEKISALVAETIKSHTLKSQCMTAWDQALEIAKIRNAIVHNPIVFGWSSGSEVGPPDIIGVPDVGHLGAKPRVSQPVASLAEINARVNETAKLASQLFELRAKYATEQ